MNKGQECWVMNKRGNWHAGRFVRTIERSKKKFGYYQVEVRHLGADGFRWKLMTVPPDFVKERKKND